MEVEGPIRRMIQRGDSTGESISDELFCAIYELFFEDMVKEFITTMIAEKIKLTVPILPRQVADWAAGQLGSLQT